MSDFTQVDQARRMLGLAEEASMEEIKEAFRQLALECHPDRSAGKEKKSSEDRFKKITHARDVIVRYCAGYRYSFREKDVRRNSFSRQEYEHMKRFYHGLFGDVEV